MSEVSVDVHCLVGQRDLGPIGRLDVVYEIGMHTPGSRGPLTGRCRRHRRDVMTDVSVSMLRSPSLLTSTAQGNLDSLALSGQPF